MIGRRKTLMRMINIQRVLVRHGLDDIITETHFMRPLRYVFKLFPRAKDVSPNRWANAFAWRLIELGPIFVKFGQAISTRRDLLPPDIADELAIAAGSCAAVPGGGSDRDTGRGLRPVRSTKYFRDSTRNRSPPLQSRRFTPPRCTDGKEVIVKLLRPGVRELIERDLDVLYAIAGSRRSLLAALSKRLRPLEVVGEYEKTIIDELDHDARGREHRAAQA